MRRDYREGTYEFWRLLTCRTCGCVAAGETREEVERLIREAIEEHLALLRADGGPIPEPTSDVTYVEAPAA